MAVSINCDLGEAFGIWRLGDDEGACPSSHTQTLPADITHPIPAPCGARLGWPSSTAFASALIQDCPTGKVLAGAK